MIYELSESITPISSLNAPVSCALGCFDGVHLGHRALIEETLNDQKNGYVSAVWTFSEPLGGEFIENVRSRLSICGALGVQNAICEDFGSVRELTPREFVMHLYNDFGVRKFVCGRDFRFGFNREGSAETLKALATELGAKVTVIEPITLPASEEKVSSTYIRSLITVNQRIENGRVVPKLGVYCSACVFDGKSYPAVTNIGCRPTVNTNESDVTCETHIIGENFDLYGKTVTVELYRYLRPEKQFPSLSALRQAIEDDCKAAEEYFLLF